MKKILLSLLLLTSAMMAPLAADIQRADPAPKTQVLDLKKVFADAPLIYSLLLVMSMSSVVLWLYTLATFRAKEIMPKSFVDELRLHLKGQEYDKALAYCQGRPNLLASIVAAGLATRKHGPQVMIDAMKSEGKRASASFWQKLSLLNDIAIVAPMLGLLGTVIGMFYAFYDVNRSIESINALFDGLGIAVGTTVAGLIVSIVSMIFSTTLKYRLVKNLSLVENEALVISSQVEGKWN